MYDVTRDVGYAVNGTKAAIADAAEGVCDAIGWLIISLGAIDICFFVYKLVKASEASAIEVKAKVQAEENVSQPQIIDNKRQTKSNICQCGELHYASELFSCLRITL